jgi:hypothetical protein
MESTYGLNELQEYMLEQAHVREQHTFEGCTLLVLHLKVLLDELIEVTPFAVLEVHEVPLLLYTLHSHRLVTVEALNLNYVRMPL